MDQQRDNYSTENYMDKKNPWIRKVKKELLKAAYSPAKRIQEIICCILFFISLPFALWNIISNYTNSNFFAIFFGSFLGILLADFMSGLVHWGADTWGSLEWPFLGRYFIRSFREHHVSPTAMCEHDMIETNGDNFMLCILPLYLMGTKDLMSNSLDGFTPSAWDMFAVTFWTWGSMFVALTNQNHKWAHTSNPPKIVTLLQKYWIILPKKNHGVHHKPAFDGYYCITTGWLNPLLDGTGFWRFAEKIVTLCTGCVPREDDYKWTGLSDGTPDSVKDFIETKRKIS